jgi:hypothetical protein
MESGCPTYRKQVIDYWPACIECDAPIRRSISTGRPGMWRTCNCPGVVWHATAHGWVSHPWG